MQRRFYGWTNDAIGTRWTPAVRALLGTMAAVFVTQLLVPLEFNRVLLKFLALSSRGLKAGFFWQPVTYIFLHAGLVHLLLNGLVLHFLGPGLERAVGTKQFLIIFILSGVLGGLGWWLITESPYAYCIGASGACFGILGAFAALFPHAPLTVLLFFVVPVTLPAWAWGLILVGSDLILMISPHAGGIAYAAHVAGGIAGYVYTSVVFCNGEPFRTAFQRLAERRKSLSNRWKYEPVPSPEEVDRILEKVAREGMQSLTPKEREVLTRAAEERRRPPR